MQIVLYLLFILSPVWSQAEALDSVESEALETLKRMNDYLLSRPAVAFRAIEEEEEVLNNGQKIMSTKEIRFAMLRPNKFHVQRHSVGNNLEMFYDGVSFTLFQKDLNFFTSVAAPATVSEVFVELENKRNIQVVAQDLLRDDSYDLLQASFSSGFVVGKSLVQGVLCTQLAFRTADTDMQIWITQGDQPLPRKFIITSRWITGAPQYTVSFFDWDTQSTLDKSVFIFKAPQDAHEIPFAETTIEQEANE
jgi:hypothetical protein